MPEKCILIILDGIGDRAFENLDNKTPLQAARTPFLDSLAARGSSGLLHASLQGEALPSEHAHFSLFGYEPAAFPGRGALEALGSGIDLDQDDVALLAHIASVQECDGKLIVVEEKARASATEAARITEALCSYKAGTISIEFIPTGNLSGIVRMRGPVSPHVTDTNLMLDGLAIPAVLPHHTHNDDQRAMQTARALQDYLVWIYKKLAQHPVNAARRRSGKPERNFLVTQRAGQLRSVEPLQIRFGLRGLSIASGTVYHGLCAYLGFDVSKAVDIEDPEIAIAERLKTAYKLRDSYDFIHVHTKAADEAAHRKDPVLKKKVIEALDRGLEKGLKNIMNDREILLMVTADHSTPSCGSMIHCGEPVPLTICGRWVRRDAVTAFDEVSAACGSLGCVRGGELMHMVLNYLDRGKLKGIMDTPQDRPYYPGTYRPLEVKK